MKFRFAAPLLLLWALAGAQAQADEKPSLGVGLGLVDASNVGTTLWLNGNVRFSVSSRIEIEPEIGYWSKSDSFFGVDVSISDFNFGATALYRIPKDKLTFHVGAGAGLHHLSGRVGVLDFFEESDTATKLGLHVLGSLEYHASDAVRVFGRVRLDMVSDVNQTKLYAGVRFKL